MIRQSVVQDSQQKVKLHIVLQWLQCNENKSAATNNSWIYIL